MPKVTISYIDDESHAAGKRYANRISRDSTIDCKPIPPPPDLQELAPLVSKPPDLYLIDYELSLKQPQGTRAAYQGSTLATEIRNRRPDYPIVLITREAILNRLNRQTRYQLVNRMQLCDELILKDDLDTKLDDTRELLRSLAEGFQLLRSLRSKSLHSLIKAMGANEVEASLLGQAAPPLQDGQWIVTAAASWIRTVVLWYPGILYDGINAATQLGISDESFHNTRLQRLMKPAKYTGIFAPVSGLWWKGRLLKIAKELIEKQGAEGPINRAFSDAFREKYKVELKPAICVWDHTPIADWVCHVLCKPVKIKHSLRYYPDNRPSVMDGARVSFRAVRESPEFDQDLLDAEGKRLLKQVRRLPEPHDQ